MFEWIDMFIQGVLALLHKYPVQLMGMWATGQWLFGVVVDSLLEPVPTDRWYKTAYRLLHGLAGNRSEYKKTFDPPAQTGLPNFPTTR